MVKKKKKKARRRLLHIKINRKKKPVKFFFFWKSAVCVCRVNPFIATLLMVVLSDSFFFPVSLCVVYSLYKGLHLLFRKRKKKTNALLDTDSSD